jgi:hypothetical protein
VESGAAVVGGLSSKAAVRAGHGGVWHSMLRRGREPAAAAARNAAETGSGVGAGAEAEAGGGSTARRRRRVVRVAHVALRCCVRRTRRGWHVAWAWSRRALPHGRHAQLGGEVMAAVQRWTDSDGVSASVQGSVRARARAIISGRGSYSVVSQSLSRALVGRWLSTVPTNFLVDQYEPWGVRVCVCGSGEGLRRGAPAFQRCGASTAGGDGCAGAIVAAAAAPTRAGDTNTIVTDSTDQNRSSA